MIICFYHEADNDGQCSGAIVKAKFPDCKLIGINYGQPFPWNEIRPDDTVIVTDFCVQPIDRMIHLSKKCHLIWIDHHATTMEDASLAGFNPDGIRVIGKSGCELTWGYFFQGKRMPTPVHLIGRYDVWDHSDPRVLPFMYGMRMEDSTPENDELWNELLSDDTTVAEKILEHGYVTYPYQKKEDERCAKACSFEADFGGYRAIMMNVGGANSLVYESVYDPEKHDIMLSFRIGSTGSVKCSIYSEKPSFDAGKICGMYSGGGHREAGGFEVLDPQKFFKMYTVTK